MNKLQKTLAVQAATMFLCLVSVSIVDAEIRTITARGEYRMGDNDTRADAKKLALLDAKRIALEQVGTYVESITEVKNFDLSREEIRAYTAGIVEVTEQASRSMMEGETTIVRVDVTCRIDTDVVAQKIEALRRSETAKSDLLRIQQETERLREENEMLHQSIAAAKSKAEVETLSEERHKVLAKLDAKSLLAQAWVELGGSKEGLVVGTSSATGRTRARSLIEQALALDVAEPSAHYRMAFLLVEEGNFDGAIKEFRMALRLKPDHAGTHDGLGTALKEKGDLDGAIAEHRTALRLKPDRATYHSNLGNALRAKGDRDGAIEEFRAALLLQSNLAETRVSLGATLLDKGYLDKAIVEYREALRLKPDHGHAHLGLGFALAAEGQRSEAAREFREYLRLTPDTPANRPWIEKTRAALRELE